MTADPEFVNRFNLFDFGVIGDGEITFLDLTKRILQGERVKGLFAGKRVKDLDLLPFPARHLIDLTKYYDEYYGYHFATVHTTRGCPFNCVFCSNPVTGREVRFRSPKNVVDEIEYVMAKSKAKYILFTDDTFTLNRKRSVILCNEILRRGLRISWGCETRADLVDESLLRLMHKSGCQLIAFGVESGNEELRMKVIRKRITNGQLFRAFRICHKLKIETAAYCMLGFPSETKQKMYETLGFALNANPKRALIRLIRTTGTGTLWGKSRSSLCIFQMDSRGPT